MIRAPYLQQVRGIWRVRVPVDEAVQPHLPPPHTGKANLTKSLGTSDLNLANRLSVPITAGFLEMIEGTKEWQAIHQEGRELNGRTLDDLIRRGPASYRPFFSKVDRKLDAIFGEPAWKQAAALVTFESMIDRWGKPKGKQTRQSMETKCGAFCDFLGHDNMVAVRFQDGGAWRDDMISGILAPGTISNYLKAVKSLFTYAADNSDDDDPLAANVMARVKYSPGDGDSREDFTPDDRVRILTQARTAPPHIYWLNWVCSFMGCRNGEIADISTLDFEIIDGFHILGINTKHRQKGQTVKTTQSKRKLVIHPACVEEGFFEFVLWVVKKDGHGPLFRDITPDYYGRRAGPITSALSDWLRNTVGIKDPRKPF